MDQGRLEALLSLVYDPRAAPQDKRAAEAELQAFSRTCQALEWALHVLSGTTAADMQAAFFAVTCADEAVLYRWRRLDAAQQVAARDCLWRCVCDPGRPHFGRSKLAGSLAHIICLEWPSAWPALQACLSDPARMEAGVGLLAATLDHFHSLAQATSFGLKGKVLSASIPAIQQHYRELQPVALGTLCSLLHTLRGSLARPGEQGGAALALAPKALRALRQALADASKLPTDQGVSGATVAGLLFGFVAAAAPGDGGDLGDEADEAVVEVAAAALDCVADLQAKFFAAHEAQEMLEVVVPRLQDTCALVHQRWAHEQQQGGSRLQRDDPLLTAFVRLLIQFFTTQLSAVEASPRLAAMLRSILGRVLALSTARQSPVDLLLFLEVWHAVLTYLDAFEAELWEAGDDLQARERVKQAAAAYKEPILAVSDLVLATLCPAGADVARPPPFTLAALSTAPGSGSAVDDWLQSVVAGGDAGAEGERGAEAQQAAEEEEGEEGGELLVPGVASQGGSPFQPDSEVDMYVRHAELFLGRAVGSFSADRLPWVLLHFQASSRDFAAACQQAAAAAAAAARGGGAAPAAAAALAQQLPAFRGMDVMLRLLTRCGPSFPTRGAAEQPAPLAAGSGEAASGAHAVQCMRALCQLAAVWLQAVQALAAATRQAGQPSTPAHLAAGGEAGGGVGLAAMLLAGSRLHQALGSLTATWLSQLITGLVQGSADPDAGPVARELLWGVLSSGAATLQAATSPGLAGWQGALHRAAVWSAESLVSLSSIALSSSLKPPAALLQALWGPEQAQLRQVAHASLAAPALLPMRACRALWLSLSDLALRCWPAQPAAQFDAEARSAAFTNLVAPLVQLFQQAAAAASGGGGLAGEAAAAARSAASACACIVQSYSGSPKALRSIVGAALAAPALPSVVAILHATGSGSAGGGPLRSKAAMALLRLVTACLDVLATELGTEGVEQLLAALVQVFSATGTDPSFETDLLMMRLVASVLSQGGSHRHGTLVVPALQYCLGVWDRTASPQAAVADADLPHVRAEALAALLALLRYRWRALAGGGAKPAAEGPGPGAAAHPLAAGLHAHAAAAAAAAAAAQQAAAVSEPGGAAEGGGTAVIRRVLELLVGYFDAAAALHVVLAVADVRLVLEELFELHVATRLYGLPAFQPARAPLASSLLSMLASRLYGGAQEALADTLFSLAAANWTEFHLSTLPRFVEARLAPAGLGPSEQAALLELFGQADLQAHSFERALLAFLNDAAFYERAADHAAP